MADTYTHTHMHINTHEDAPPATQAYRSIDKTAGIDRQTDWCSEINRFSSQHRGRKREREGVMRALRCGPKSRRGVRSEREWKISLTATTLSRRRLDCENTPYPGAVRWRLGKFLHQLCFCYTGLAILCRGNVWRQGETNGEVAQ